MVIKPCVAHRYWVGCVVCRGRPLSHTSRCAIVRSAYPTSGTDVVRRSIINHDWLDAKTLFPDRYPKNGLRSLRAVLRCWPVAPNPRPTCYNQHPEQRKEITNLLDQNKQKHVSEALSPCGVPRVPIYPVLLPVGGTYPRCGKKKRRGFRTFLGFGPSVNLYRKIPHKLLSSTNYTLNSL